MKQQIGKTNALYPSLALGWTDMSSLKYWAIGEPVAGAWNAGKKLKKRE